MHSAFNHKSFLSISSISYVMLLHENYQFLNPTLRNTEKHLCTRHPSYGMNYQCLFQKKCLYLVLNLR